MENLKHFGSIFGDKDVIKNTHLELYLRNNVGNFILIKTVKVTGKSNNRINSKGINNKVQNNLNFIDLGTNINENVVYGSYPQWIKDFNTSNGTDHGMDALKYKIISEKLNFDDDVTDDDATQKKGWFGKWLNGGKRHNSRRRNRKFKKSKKSRKNRKKSKRTSRR